MCARERERERERVIWTRLHERICGVYVCKRSVYIDAVCVRERERERVRVSDAVRELGLGLGLYTVMQ